ncbi:sensor histidine kinase [Jannaschia sp.]|nr:sensor histidine kinase [Jannaschia sp.]
MTLSLNLLLAACLTYVAILFLVAFASERAAERGRMRLLRGPWVYTLSLSVYCTAWTFYGAVGYAARSGLEFITIYLGPTLVFVGWWWLLRKLVAIGRAERITSIADMISSRYGKSNMLAVLVTLLAVMGTTPYIALQLQSVTSSFAVFAEPGNADLTSSALWVALGLAVFTILFGTRRLDAGERHHGIVGAIAVEAIVKLVALLSVGIFVVWGLAGGPAAVAATIDASPISDWSAAPGRWAGLITVSAAAIICLPRMFQVLVVENSDERHLITASWAFPLYLMAMSLFVLPIAAVGLARMPEGANPDLFVLTLPLAEGRDGLAMLAFLGGFSSATSMVIVAAVALATMLSNHVVMPLWLASRAPQEAQISGDVRTVILRARRASILVVLGLGYLYFRFTGGTAALASIGLISFVGMAQVLPALVFGLFWRGATGLGAAAGIVTGFALWAWTMLVPVFGGAAIDGWLTAGPGGLAWLRPQAMFGISGDPLLSAVAVSLGLNCIAFCAVSLASRPSPMEQLQAPRFVQVFDRAATPRGRAGGQAGADELLIMAQRILGAAQAQAIFAAEARVQGRLGELPQPTPALIERLERELAGSVGAATANAMVSGITGDAAVSVEDLIAVADETAQVMEYSARLEAREAELTRTARELRETNDKLTLLAQQKDAFLSQVSHELRTPMTSIRAFSEILREDGLGPEERSRYSGIILDESQRLTRLLDDLLDLTVLENGQIELHPVRASLGAVIDRAVTASSSAAGARLVVHRDRQAEAVEVVTDPDRLAQVFINLVTNAAKYCDAARPELRIVVGQAAEELRIDFIDNGTGIAPRDRGLIFEKFARLSDQAAAGSAGLGLAICREVMTRLGGGVEYLPGQGGGAFRVRLPLPEEARLVLERATLR